MHDEAKISSFTLNFLLLHCVDRTILSKRNVCFRKRVASIDIYLEKEQWSNICFVFVFQIMCTLRTRQATPT